MPDKNLLAEINSEHEDINWRGVSDASDKVTVTVAGDSLAPAAPSSLAATSIPEGVKLEFVSPTTNADGTTCVDERWIKVYWQSTTGVSKSSYDGNVVIAGRVGENQTYTDTNVSSGTTRYYVVTAIDANGNESTESNEAHADGGNVDITTVIPDDASGYIFDDSFGADGEGVALGDGVIGIIFKHHNSSWTNFSHYRLWRAEDSGGGFGSWSEITPINQVAVIDKGLNTSYHYKYKASIVANDGTESTTPDYATNNSNTSDGGAGYQPNKDNNSLFDGTVLVGNLVSAGEVRGEHFYAQSYLAINDSAFGNDGIQLEYNGGDPRAYIGNGATDSTGRFIKFDGTDLSWQGKNSSLTADGVFTATDAVITGALTAGAGSSISGAYISSLSFDKITAATNNSSLTIGSSGYIQSSNYSAGSAGFKINGDGSAELYNATIRGSLNASDLSGGTITALVYQTASSGARLEISPVGWSSTPAIKLLNSSGQWTVTMYNEGIQVGPGNSSRGWFYTSSGVGTLWLRGTSSSINLTIKPRSTETGKTAQDEYLRVDVNGNTRYVKLYA